MINIMYLVLTALLALNVSAEILNAFKTVEYGIKSSYESVNAKNNLIYDVLVASAQDDGREESLALIDAADEARKYRKELKEYIEVQRAMLIEESGGEKELKDGSHVLVGKKDTETTTRILVDGGLGKEMQEKINDYKKKFSMLIPEKDRAEYASKLTLKADDPEDASKGDWATNKFRKVPVQAVMTIFTGLEADAYNAESTVLDYLSKQVGFKDVKVDQFEAMAVSESKYLLTGKEFVANIFLGAKSSQIEPEVYLGTFTDAVVENEETGVFERIQEVPADQMPLTGAEPLEVDADGRAQYKVTATGSRKMDGVIKVQVPGTELFDFYPFRMEYETFQAGDVVISPTAMNVLYIGLDNPVSITAGNANPSTVAASGCGIRKNGSQYLAKPTGSPRRESISVSGRTNEGDAVSGSMEFRVMRIPDPYMWIANKKGGAIARAVFQAQAGPYAKNPDFVFDVNYRIVSFDMIYAPRTGPVISTNSNQNKFTSEQKTIISKLKAGDRVFFSNVKVRLPDGTVRPIATNFTII
jgi:gliding motility-associated protein GldM